MNLIYNISARWQHCLYLSGEISLVF